MRLQHRIVAVFLGLLLLVQAASFFTIRRGIDANARRDVAQGMGAGETLLRRLLAQNAQQLSEAARLLAADYGFRAAVSTRDGPTLTDALANQADRIGASVAIFTNPAHQPVASTAADDARTRAVLAADAVTRTLLPAAAPDAPLSQTTMNPAGAKLLVIDERPFQIVTVPVKAPQLVGYVSMGFPLGASIVRDLGDLSAARAVFVGRDASGSAASPWRPLPVIGDAPLPTGLAAALAARELPESATIGGESTALHLVRLSASGDTEVDAILLRSIDDAVEPYRKLQFWLLAITLVGVGVFALGSVITARRITRPLGTLAESAERLAAGDYTSPIPAVGDDEVGHLARSFESMRVGIRERDGEIRRLAFRDPLTGLPNRTSFRELVAERLVVARRSGDPCSVMLLGLDRFKLVNDVAGHAVGDRLLAAIAERLSAGVRNDRDVVARLSGDTFAICLPRAGVDAAVDLAHRVRGALDRPFTLDDRVIDVSASVGIASFPAQAIDADALLARAEIAMYSAKARQTGVSVYDPALDASSQASLSLLGELRTAIDHDQLRLFLQPKFSLDTGLAVGAEALVRWQHPRRGLLGPAEFVPFAERTGFVRELTGWMVDRAARRSAVLRDDGLDLSIAVNLSAKDLLDPRLTTRLESVFASSHIEPSSISLEITESAMMNEPDRALATLRDLDGMGVHLSIDDFGTGYSSLAYLKTLPIHELKIDRSFVMGMERDRADLKIVRSTVELAHNLGYRVVAEGVETAQTWAILRALACDQAQGYFMAKPMPEAQIGDWLAGWKNPQTRLATEFADLL